MQTYTDNVFATDHAVQTDMQNIEDNFAALKSAFSGATTPSDTVAGMWWFDTTANILKLRNEANNAWQSVWNFANNKPIVTNNISADFGAALKDPAAATAGLRTLGTTALKACAGNDARLSDTRTPPDSSVTQSKLKTSQGSVNNSTTGNPKAGGLDSGYSNRILPGGEYGFYPQIKVVNGHAYGTSLLYAEIATGMASMSYITNVTVRITVSSVVDAYGTYYGYVQQRYVTSSGEVFWIFILRTKYDEEIQGKDVDGDPMTYIRPKGTIMSMYQAPDHPCFGNGGKPSLVPHPFGSYDPETQEIVVINPSEKEVTEMKGRCEKGEEEPDKDLLEIITEEYEIDENSAPRWPTKAVTVGLPKDRDWKRDPDDTKVIPIKKVIPQPEGVLVKKLRRK